MLFRFSFAAIGLALAALLPLPARACSPVPDYRVPTNLELAQTSELIMLGRVTGPAAGNSDDFVDGAIVVEPLAAIKGSLPAAPITIPSMTLAEGELARFGVLSNPYDLQNAHPASYIGGCIRYLFPRGTTALFFLAHGPDGTWRPAGGPFSRWAEDVLSDDAPWLRLTRFYAATTTAPESERSGLLERERARLAALPDPVSALMAKDIERQLAGPNRPYRVLMREMIERDARENEAALEAADNAEAAAESVAAQEEAPQPH